MNTGLRDFRVAVTGIRDAVCAALVHEPVDQGAGVMLFGQIPSESAGASRQAAVALRRDGQVPYGF
jgi:hypothetical protein